MAKTLDLELEVATDLSPVEIASKIVLIVGETLEAMRQSLGVELEFDIFLVLDGREVRFVMEPDAKLQVLRVTKKDLKSQCNKGNFKDANTS